MEIPPAIPETAPSTPQPPAMSLMGRLMNVFATPAEVFEGVKDAPVSNTNWFAPALIFVAVSWVGVSLILSQESFRRQMTEISEQAVQKQLDKMENTRKTPMSKEEAEKAREMGAKYGVISTEIGSVVGPVFAAFVTPFWWGLLLWLGGKVFKAHFDYMKAVEVAGLGNMIGVLGAVLRGLLIIVTGSLFASPSLMLLVKDFNPQNPVHGLLAAINIMTFWALAVWSLGLARLCGVAYAKAAAWVFGLWAGITGLLAGFAAAAQALANRAGG